MIIEFTHHEGSQSERPPKIDTVSSSTVVYIRKNIKEIEKTNEVTGETYKFWEYDEARLTPNEYAIYLAEQTAAKTDYIAMMAGIDIAEV